ncbi:MAG: NupC/NupG family nucleoside CNT transporter [Gammaproteobacteria bacterium]|nr:NupC/NupG family nucleoside CNT transporter [Gammaproteobacteria bacterium]TVQ50605.1 MAG: NupC/NupG family nucleoside CNT transporter [Gammaproteobacteria bacterium]
MLSTLGFGVFGFAVLIGLAWACSSHRRAVDWRLVGTGLALQLGLALFVLLTPFGTTLFDALARGFVRVISFSREGATFIFGDFVDVEQFGFVFALQVLPTIVFFAALMSVLYHLGVMQRIVRAMSWAITRVMRVSGAETLAVSANVFVGQTEAPLVVRPYISAMTQSELMTLMVGGMATIAGGVMAAYVVLLGGGDPATQAFYAKHLLSASVMAAPAALVVAKLLMPEVDRPLTLGQATPREAERTTTNVIEAAAVGAGEGVKLALNVGGMLLAFLALIALINFPLVWVGEATGLSAWLGGRQGEPVQTDLALLLGYLLSPLAWITGVPWSDAPAVGSLIGQKVVANEFVAYVQLAQVADSLSERGLLIATYALCGFANFASIAIQIGGIGGIAPDRRADLARFGLRAVLGGTLATLMTATMAGVITSF